MKSLTPPFSSGLSHPFAIRAAAGKLALAFLSMVAVANSASAASGTWITPTSGGFWSDTFNWSGDIVASGADSTADFSTLDLTSNNSITMDLPYTLGYLKFGDITPDFNWSITGSDALTLQTTSPGTTPAITVNNQTATIGTALAGNQGFIKNGAGTLVLSTTANTWTGNAVIKAGTLSVNVAQDPTAGFQLANGATLTSNQALATTNIVTALSGSSTYTNTVSNNTSLAGNGNVTFSIGNTTSFTVGFLSNFGGVATKANNNAFRYMASSGGNGGTALAPFATLDFGNAATTGGIYTRNGGTIILGGISGTSTAANLGAASFAGTGNYVVGSANSSTSWSGYVQGGNNQPLLTKVGTGTLTVNSLTAWTSTGAVAVNGGTLLMDYTNLPTGIFNAASALTFGGGKLTLLAKNTGATTQTVGNVTVNAGGGELVVNPNGGDATTLTMGTLTATAVGGALNIQPPSASIGSGLVTITTTTNKAADGTYGARVTYGSDWATTNSVASPYTLSAYSGYTPFVGSGGNSATNYLLTDGGVATGSETFNSLKIATTGAGGSLDLGGQILTLTNGGLLFSGANDYTIGVTAGDTLKSNVATNSALVIQQLGTGNLTIASVIANGNGAQTLTKAGSGKLTLTGVNTYTGQTYINKGIVSIAANSALGDEATGATINLNGGTLQATSTFGLFNGAAGTNNRNIVLYGGGGTLDVTGGNNLTVAGAISNVNTSNLGPLVKTGTGTLTLTGANSYGGATIISGGVLSVGTLIDSALYLNRGSGETTVTGSAVVTVDSTAGVSVGQTVIGNSFPTGTTVLSVDSATQLTLSANSTQKGNNTLVVYTPNPLGTSPNTANSLVLDGGTLQYTGAATSTNRSFMLTQNGGGLDASGSGALTFSSTIPGASRGSGNRTLTLTGTNTGNNTLAIPMEDASATVGASGTVGITKNGVGKWVLSSANNAYTGATTVNAGTLALSSAASTNNISTSSSIAVAAGATLDVTGLSGGTIKLGSSQNLSGSGSILGAVTTVSGSSVTPGSAGLGTLTTGAFTINTGSVFNFELQSPSTSDLISVTDLTLAALTGGLNGGGFNLYQVGTLNKFTQTGSYKLFQYSGSLVGNPSSLFSASSILNAQSGLTYTFDSTTFAGYVTLTIGGTAAQISQWIATTDGVWSNAANWDAGGVANSIGGTANFTTAQSSLRTVTLDGSRTVGVINFDSAVGGYAIANGSGTLTLNNGSSSAAVGVTNGSHSIGAPIALTSDVLVTVTNANDQLAISGAISNTSTAKTLTKLGNGTLVLSGANSYGPAAGSVGTILNAGILQVGNNLALGAGDLSVIGSATLQAGTAGLTLANNIIASGGVVTTIDTQSNTFTLSGVLSESGGTASVVKTGSGTLVITAADTYTGSTTINAGTLQIGDGGTTGALAGNIVNNGALVLNRSDDHTNSNTISGTGTLTKIGLGNVTLAGTNTFTGDTVLSAGIMTLGNALALQGSTLNYDNQGGTLSFGALTAATLGGLKGAQNISLLNDSLGAVTLTVGGNNQSTTYSGVLDGAGAGLTKAGAGTLTLMAAQTYTGATNVNTGVLSVGATGVINGTAINTTANLGGSFHLDGGSVTTSALSTINSGSSMIVNSGSATFNGGLRLNSTGSDGNLVAVNGGTLTATDISITRSSINNAAPTATAPIAGSTTSGLYVNGAGAVVSTGTMTIGTSNSSASSRIDAGSFTASGQFTIGRTTNSGRWNVFQVNGGSFVSTDATNGVVIAPNNGTTGNSSEFYISGGTATAERIAFGEAADTVGGTGWLIVGGGELYVGSQGIVQANVTGLYSAKVALLSGTLGASADWSSDLAMQFSGTNFTVKAADAANAAHNITLNGSLSGSGALTKTGGGILTLGGINTRTGDTVVSEGALNLADNAQMTFSIGANGVSNRITGTGILSLAGDFFFDLSAADQTVGNVWNIVDVTNLSETFESTFSVINGTKLGDVWTVTSGGDTLSFSEATGDLTLMAVPEPGTIALLIGGAGLLIVFRRRRVA